MKTPNVPFDSISDCVLHAPRPMFPVCLPAHICIGFIQIAS